MPFTPIHMGVGLVIKPLMQRGFSLMVFGWSQIVMDIQPLINMVLSIYPVHGISHTYIGATFIAIFCGITGKYLGEYGLKLIKEEKYMPISFKVAFISAFIGTYTHVFLDSIMHSDMSPFYPFSQENNLLLVVGIDALHMSLFISGILGVIVYYVRQKYFNKSHI